MDERAEAFFERQGFTSVGRDAVPASKWRGYDRRRIGGLKVLRREIEAEEKLK